VSAPPLAASGQSNQKRNFVDSYYLLSIVGAVFNRDLRALAYTHKCSFTRAPLPRKGHFQQTESRSKLKVLIVISLHFMKNIIATKTQR
jgi:hypothetical protein